jgi:hypothetical protein
MAAFLNYQLSRPRHRSNKLLGTLHPRAHEQGIANGQILGSRVCRFLMRRLLRSFLWGRGRQIGVPASPASADLFDIDLNAVAKGVRDPVWAKSSHQAMAW